MENNFCDKIVSGRAADLDDIDNPDWKPSILNPSMGQDAEDIPLQIVMPPSGEGIIQNPILPDGVEIGQPPISQAGGDIGQPPISQAGGDIGQPLMSPAGEEIGQPPASTTGEGNEEPSSSAGAASQTSLTCEDIEKMTEDLAHLREEVNCLKAQLRKLRFDPASFQDNPKRTKYLTGLENYDVLMSMSVFQLAKPYIKCHLKRVTKIQHFILTLHRLTLNLDFQLLAFQFNVSAPTASNVFFKCIDVLYQRLKKFVVWPSRKELQCNIPEPFQREFGKKVAVR